MIPHHQEAVDTSSWLAEMSQNPELKKLFKNIMKGRKEKIFEIF
jgi:uncharacterized protein (DUF305 family)